MTKNRTTFRPGAFAAACLSCALLFGACSSGRDYVGAAKDTIEGELADQIDLGALKADCPEPEGDLAIDDTFPCTAVTTDGAGIDVTATVTAEDEVGVATNNVILGSNMGEIERIAAENISQTVGVDLPVANFDCPDQSVVVEAGTTVLCALTDPASNAVYDTTLSELKVDDPTNVTFNFVVATEPRP